MMMMMMLAATGPQSVRVSGMIIDNLSIFLVLCGRGCPIPGACETKSVSYTPSAHKRQTAKLNLALF